ncbi:hypothetical protein GALMADRAFT_1122939 [Galerina marginata CBS 339.88]|uniref:pyranose dehydrogenase (acceptor) n=1 Tax=Galerina marginata (strain CBS 339.88) TaxID=685588 RepID=A0A067TDC0_GALM3|nr:hypothetical protein GALMADRAFT_1122939 [Galerina marginata CBS 339.88]
MWNIEILLITLAILTAPGQSNAQSPPDLQRLHSRGVITSETDIQTSYDYIIAGGGLAGLVLASRLSEDSSVSVLVLEAGKSGDEIAERINTPAGTYYSSMVGTEYDWQHGTVPQPNLNDQTIGWPRGKVLGGSSAMNAMYLVRPSSIEMDAWQSLLSPTNDGASGGNWGWESMYGFMKKAENFTPPTSVVQELVNISYDASTHGSGGSMQLSYPAVMINTTALWLPSLALAGIPSLSSPNGGTTLGGFIAPSSINPTNYTRSYSRSAYIDSLPPRSNLDILAEATVTRVVLSDVADAAGAYHATGVEFARSTDAASSQLRTTTVKVRKEVLLAGGALGSPKMLMHSGVGPRDVLEAAGVDVKVELPGVGQHLQDHLTAGVVWETPYETAGDIKASNSDFSNTPEFLSSINDAVAFVNLTALFPSPSSASAEFQAQILSALAESAAKLVPSRYPEVVEGYKAIYETTANTFLSDSGVAQVEMLMSVVSPGRVVVQAALQHPFSQGRAYINSSNPFDPILIDPQYFSHFADQIILRQGIKLVRSLSATFGSSLGAEITPGPNVQSDAEIEAWLVRGEGGAGTQYHPTGSCAMLPKEKAGVVAPDLRVYGLVNVRVVDASVFPFEFAAHLASATYGVAEQAAALIKAKSYTVPDETTSSARSFAPPFYLGLCAAVVYAVLNVL